MDSIDECIINIIKQYLIEHGYTPSYREIADKMNYKTVFPICERINTMIDAGYLETDNPHCARAIRVPGIQISFH